MVTYKLKGKNIDSDRYYKVSKGLAKKFIYNVFNSGEDFLEDFIEFIKCKNIEDLRSKEEYSIEIALIGILLMEYMENGRAFMNKSMWIFLKLNELRIKKIKYKDKIDQIRGKLNTKVLLKRKKGKEDYNLYNFYLVLRWIQASGDFNEEILRIKNWYEFLEKQEKDYVEDFLKYSVALGNWICSEGEEKLDEYLQNVDNYLSFYKEKHLNKEDIIFCGKRKAIYYLNIIGAEIMNMIYENRFKKCEKKVVYLPSCMRKDVSNCKAKKEEQGYKCQNCSAECNVNIISKLGEENNFTTLIIPHETEMFRIKGDKSIGVIGVACILNLLSGGWKAIRMSFIPQCVVLEYCGCSKHWCEKDIPTEINTFILKSKLHIANNMELKV